MFSKNVKAFYMRAFPNDTTKRICRTDCHGKIFNFPWDEPRGLCLA